MIRVIALEDYLVDSLRDLALSHRKNVESGSTIPDQPVADELSDMDVILNALQNTDVVT